MKFLDVKTDYAFKKVFCLAELQTAQDKWIYFIKNAGKLDCIPEQVQPEIKQALEIANEANFSPEELELQHKRKEFIYIQKSSINLALETGFDQGVEKGIEQGIKAGSLQTKTQIVLNAHKAGLTTPLIASIAGLSEADVNSIIQNNAR